jgi:hypothetical protein
MTSEVELIMERAGKLSADETLTLLQSLTASLRRKISVKQSSNENVQVGLVYGKYKNFPGPETSEEDFKLAEYQINEDDWK